MPQTKTGSPRTGTGRRKLSQTDQTRDGQLKLRIDFGPFGILGPGKIALMEGIARHGSISAAGKDLAMSYRRAWELAEEINHIFATPLIEKQTGGSGGGGARLSEFGVDVVQRFRAIERACAEACDADLRVLRANLPTKPLTAA
ncbi:MAG: LysR family transcriptional regulator [Hyphomicrobiales bacterium]|nr:MAG: LysR family transcriptional regulator [Hyphomicrobiales bacterium]